MADAEAKPAEAPKKKKRGKKGETQIAKRPPAQPKIPGPTKAALWLLSVEED